MCISGCSVWRPKSTALRPKTCAKCNHDLTDPLQLWSSARDAQLKSTVLTTVWLCDVTDWYCRNVGLPCTEWCICKRLLYQWFWYKLFCCFVIILFISFDYFLSVCMLSVCMLLEMPNGNLTTGLPLHRIMTWKWKSTENYHGSNTVMLVVTLMSVVGSVFIVFAMMALCYRSVVVHKNFSLCLRLVSRYNQVASNTSLNYSVLGCAFYRFYWFIIDDWYMIDSSLHDRYLQARA